MNWEQEMKNVANDNLRLEGKKKDLDREKGKLEGKIADLQRDLDRVNGSLRDVESGIMDNTRRRHDIEVEQERARAA